MMTLQVVLLLSVGITIAAATNEPIGPDCSRCEYYNGIGFLETSFCAAYVMCFKNPYSTDYYRHQIMCCPEGTKWDQEHLSCKRGKCDDRLICPNATTTTDLPCPLKKVDATQYAYKATHEVMSCPYGSTFDEEACTCIFLGPYTTPCWKILHYDFNNTYDSDSCYNFAAGDPYGYPSIDDNMLSLNGVDQFLSVPFLNNWFSWNPIGKTFTLCFWLRAKGDGYYSGQDAGVLSTNCRFNQNEASVAEIWLKGGEMIVSLAGSEYRTGRNPANDFWDLICITFERGHYILSYNAAQIWEKTVSSPWAINSHSDTTLGYVEGKGHPLEGYFDDFCFWTHTLSEPEIVDIFNEGPSSDGEFLTEYRQSET